jgi:hypothetical protein
MTVDEHVIVDVDASPPPVGVLEARRRQRPQRGPLDLLEERPSTLAVRPARVASRAGDPRAPASRLQIYFRARTCTSKRAAVALENQYLARFDYDWNLRGVAA